MKNLVIVILLLAAIGCSRPAAVVSDGSTPSADSIALVDGLRMFEDGHYEQARDRLTISARSSSTNIRAESFLYLNALEMELGNYSAARLHLDRYHSETIRLLRAAAEASVHMERQAARLRRDMMLGGAAILVIVVAGFAGVAIRRRKSAAIPVEPPASRIVSTEFYDAEALARADEFRSTEIWAELLELSAQKSGREARVLTLLRQNALDTALEEYFGGFANRLRAECESLTAGDVKFCCLSLLPLTAFGKALCFGSTETNIVKQRKHTIKKKLSPAIFDFVFVQR